MPSSGAGDRSPEIAVAPELVSPPVRMRTPPGPRAARPSCSLVRASVSPSTACSFSLPRLVGLPAPESPPLSAEFTPFPPVADILPSCSPPRSSARSPRLLGAGARCLSASSPQQIDRKAPSGSTAPSLLLRSAEEPSPFASAAASGAKELNRGCLSGMWGRCFPGAVWRGLRAAVLLPVSLAASVREAVGPRFFLLLVSVYLCIKGLVYSLTVSAMLPYFKALGWSATAYQQATALAFVPWGMKGLIGTLSDALPLFGYRKKYYMLLASLLGVAGVCGLCVVPQSFAADRFWLVCCLFLLSQLQVATLDLMCEGRYSELMVEAPAVGPAIVTFVNVLISVGQAFGKMLVGPVSDQVGTRPIFWLALPLAASVVPPICLNFLPEQKLEREDLQVLRERIYAQRRVFIMGCSLAAASCGVAVVSLLTNKDSFLLAYSLIAGVALSCVCFFALPRQIAFCNMYFFLDQLLHLNVSGALDFFYTASPECLPDGPHFDYTYYNTYTCVAGAVGGVIVLILFLKVLPPYSFRHILTGACLLRLGASLVDYVLVSRLTTQMHLSDRAVYLLGDAIILVGVGSLSYMVGAILISKLCPRNVEATVYAILAGMGNMGSTLSTLVGVAAIKDFHITTTLQEEGGCDFSRLPQLISISNFVLPSLCIPLCMVLLPNSAINAPLSADAPATREPSLFTLFARYGPAGAGADDRAQGAGGGREAGGGAPAAGWGPAAGGAQGRGDSGDEDRGTSRGRRTAKAGMKAGDSGTENGDEGSRDERPADDDREEAGRRRGRRRHSKHAGSSEREERTEQTAQKTGSWLELIGDSDDTLLSDGSLTRRGERISAACREGLADWDVEGGRRNAEAGGFSGFVGTSVSGVELLADGEADSAGGRRERCRRNEFPRVLL